MKQNSQLPKPAAVPAQPIALGEADLGKVAGGYGAAGGVIARQSR